MEFRLLRADEIDARVSRVTNKGVSLLLYKDARCDQNILDETVGVLNWQRHHSRDNANCIVSIWDAEKQQWIEKEDTGTESNTEAAKGLASDSFKRACFNWGLGRELYTAPKEMTFGSNELKSYEYDENRKTGKCYDRFVVTDIEYSGRQIVSVTVQDIKSNVTKTFTNDVNKAVKPNQGIEDAKLRAKAFEYINNNVSKENIEKIAKYYKVEKITDLSTDNCIDYLMKLEEKKC